MGRPFKKAILLLVGLIISLPIHAQKLQIESTISLEYINRSPPKIQKTDLITQVDLEKDIWNIELIFASTNARARGSFTLANYIVVKIGVGKHQPSGFEQLHISDFEDGYPIDVPWPEKVIWFAYCARDYLRSHDGQLVILPARDTRSDHDAHGCRITNTWRSANDLCPSRVDFLYDGELMEKSITEMSLSSSPTYLHEREKIITAYKNRVEDGHLVQRFEVIEWMRIGNLGVPKSWKLDFYSGKLHFFVIKGFTKSVAEISEVQLPPVPMNAMIYDLRFRSLELGRNELPYMITNGQISSVVVTKDGQKAFPVASTNLQKFASEYGGANFRLKPSIISEIQHAFSEAEEFFKTITSKVVKPMPATSPAQPQGK